MDTILLLLGLLFCVSYIDAERTSPKTPIGFQAEISVMGESALIDKETGRLFWEGGSRSTLVESIESKVKSHIGVDHLRATILTGAIFLGLLGFFSLQIQDRIISGTIYSTNNGRCRLITNVFLFLLKIIPSFDPIFVCTIYVLYLVESFFSSTRTYLGNIIHGPVDIERFLREMKTVRPVVEWKVRCFHYKDRSWSIPFKAIINVVGGVRRNHFGLLDKPTIFSSLFRKKVISSMNNGYFHYKQCDDKTIVAVWKRSLQTRLPENGMTAAPLIKLVVSKVVALADEEARNEYLLQQRNFVRQHAQADERAEFSTSIDFSGFQPKILMFRSKKTNPALRLLCTSYMFWFFTLFGLTVPYRILLASQCDVLRLVIVKETLCNEPARPPWTQSDKVEAGPGNFNAIMHSLQVYTNSSVDETSRVASDLLTGGLKGFSLLNRTDVYKANG